MNTQNKTTKGKRKPEYTLDDVGCYVDGARGIYCIDAIVDIAQSHGMTYDGGQDEAHEWSDEVENECDNYMNDNYGVEGAYWGRSEQGDWGLWEIEEEDVQHTFSGNPEW